MINNWRCNMDYIIKQSDNDVIESILKNTFMNSKIENEINIPILYIISYLISIHTIRCKNEFDKTSIQNEFASFFNCIFNKSSKY